jgi:hypothetical protein
MTFSDWLDARDSETLARVWSGLDKNLVEVGAPDWDITVHGAAQLAAAVLAWPIERLAWLALPDEEMPAPTFETKRTVERCFVELGIDLHGACYESWTIREECEGGRGVQHVSVGYAHHDDGTREGGGGSKRVVRVFDRAAGIGASIGIGSRSVATIGEINVAALDLFHRYQFFSVPGWKVDHDGLRGLFAQLASEVDAHFDVSTSWPAGRGGRFESGTFAVELSPRHGGLSATAHGLPWGHALSIWIDESSHGSVELCLPLAVGQAVLARLSFVTGVRI